MISITFLTCVFFKFPFQRLIHCCFTAIFDIYFMVLLILDGNSEHVVHVWKKVDSKSVIQIESTSLQLRNMLYFKRCSFFSFASIDIVDHGSVHDIMDPSEWTNPWYHNIDRSGNEDRKKKQKLFSTLIQFF